MFFFCLCLQFCLSNVNICPTNSLRFIHDEYDGDDECSIIYTFFEICLKIRIENDLHLYRTALDMKSDMN